MSDFVFDIEAPLPPVPPTVDWTTAPGSVLNPSDSIVVSVLTSDTLTGVTISATSLEGHSFLIYAGGVFSPGYETSAVIYDSTGAHFTLTADHGWTDTFSLTVSAQTVPGASTADTALYVITGGLPAPPSLPQYVESIQSLSQYIVRLKLTIPVLVDQNYLDPANYLFTQYDTDQNNVLAKEVINPFQANSSKHTRHSDEILIVTSKHSVGKVYTVEVKNLLTADSITLTGPADYPARFTKVDSMLTNFSGFYDTRPTAVLGTVMRAIAREDDIIGGAYYDHVLPKRDYMPSNVLTLNGQPLTLNGQYLVL